MRIFGQLVAGWFDQRKITENGSISGQLEKLKEEFDELEEAFLKQDRNEVMDAIGDMAVVLAGLAHMYGMTFESCCNHAWNEIKDRKGTLNEKGQFVKEC